MEQKKLSGALASPFGQLLLPVSPHPFYPQIQRLQPLSSFSRYAPAGRPEAARRIRSMSAAANSRSSWEGRADIVCVGVSVCRTVERSETHLDDIRTQRETHITRPTLTVLLPPQIHHQHHQALLPHRLCPPQRLKQPGGRLPHVPLRAQVPVMGGVGLLFRWNQSVGTKQIDVGANPLLCL